MAGIYEMARVKGFRLEFYPSTPWGATDATFLGTFIYSDPRIGTTAAIIP